MTDLMGRGTEARSRATLSAAEAQAGGALRLGDLTQQKWSGLGDTIGQGIDAYVTEQREAPRREHGLWQMEQDKIAAERALVTAGREDEQYRLEQEERSWNTEYDRIIADAELEFGANPENREARRAAVRKALAEGGLPASHLHDYDEMIRVADTHESSMLSAQAQIEAANARGASDAAIREQADKRQEYFEAIKSTRNEFGDNSPENRAARRDYFLFVGEADPVLEYERDVKLANARTATDVARDRTFLAQQYKGALASRDPSVIHAAEQALYQARIDPRTLRQSALQESYKDAIARHNARLGAPGGVYVDPNRETMDDFDTWVREANLPDVSTLGSVYAPPPGDPGLPSELEVATQLAEIWDVSVEEALQIIKDNDTEAAVPPVTPSPIGLGSAGGGYGVYPETARQIPLSIPNPLTAFGPGKTRAQKDLERLRQERATRSTGPS
jgi:hypothetical protein